MFKVGDNVGFDFGIGRIVDIKPYWNPACGGLQDLYYVRYLRLANDHLTTCPDPRCTTGCVICRRTLWKKQLRPLSL